MLDKIKFPKKITQLIFYLKITILCINVCIYGLVSILYYEQLGWHCDILSNERIAFGGCGMKFLFNQESLFVALPISIYPLLTSCILLLLNFFWLDQRKTINNLYACFYFINFILSLLFFYKLWFIIKAPAVVAKFLIASSLILLASHTVLPLKLSYVTNQARFQIAIILSLSFFCCFRYFQHVKYSTPDVASRAALENLDSEFYYGMYIFGSGNGQSAFTLVVDPECEFSRKIIRDIFPYLQKFKSKIVIVPVSLRGTKIGLDAVSMINSSNNRDEFLLNIRRSFIEQKYIASPSNGYSGPYYESNVAWGGLVTRAEMNNMLMLKKMGINATPLMIGYKNGSPMILKKFSVDNLENSFRYSP